jgi:hypothetical protein
MSKSNLLLGALTDGSLDCGTAVMSQAFRKPQTKAGNMTIYA